MATAYDPSINYVMPQVRRGKPSPSSPMAAFADLETPGYSTPASVHNMTAPLLDQPVQSPSAPEVKTGPAAPNPAPGPQQQSQVSQLPQANTSLDTDPILAQIEALRTATLGKAESGALQAKRDALLAFGSRALAEKTLGADDPTLGAISDNPDASTSQLARINRAYRDRTHATEEDLNNANLWFGGQHGLQLADLEKSKQTDIADATAGVQALLAQIGQGLLDAKTNAERERLAAALDAALRQQQAAMNAPIVEGSQLPDVNVNWQNLDPGWTGTIPGPSQQAVQDAAEIPASVFGSFAPLPSRQVLTDAQAVPKSVSGTFGAPAVRIPKRLSGTFSLR